MIPETGHFALVLALCVAAAQAVLPLVGAARGQRRWIALARPAAQAQLMLVAVAFACLAWAFVANDFSVKYVASHSNTRLPAMYRLAAVWGGHEGSMLLWTLLLAAWGVAVAGASRALPELLVARVLGVMGLAGAGFLIFVLFASNPFERLLLPPPDGRDLNPLLQDPGMVFHPPLLYMGYVGFSVVFAFAIAALLEGRLDAAWARWSRPWTTMAWAFLTLGIALGSFWAYYELGWGGWWFWDPVENASFMPWLAGTALIHSLAVTEKRGAFKAWTLLLAIFAFSLSLLGTFLVRSGVLTSVHAFATDPKRGVFILVVLAVTVGASLALYALRAPALSRGGIFEPFSRESFLLANNVLFSVAAAAVMLGTLYPLALDAFALGKISVGPPYFETVFVPLMAPAVLLLGAAPFARWKSAALAAITGTLRWLAAAALVAAVVVPLSFGPWSPLAALGASLAVWVAGSCVADAAGRLRGRSLAAWPALLPRSWVGMTLAHLGVAVFIAGVTISRAYGTDADLRMRFGDTGTVAGYTFRFDSVENVRGPNYAATRATVEVTREGRAVAVMHPEKRAYDAQRMTMTEAAIDASVGRHLYVSLGEAIAADTWIVRLYHKPLVGWIWGGCVLMALGGVLGALDRRYRVSPRTASTLRHRPGLRGTALCLAGALAIAAMLAPSTMLAADASPAAQDPALDRRVTLISETLRCLVCQNQTIADSNAPLALDLRARVREMLRAGANEQEVVDFMVARYGDFVLYRPPLRVTTSLLWFGPVLLLALGVLVGVRVLRRRHAPAERVLTEAHRAVAASLLDPPADGAPR